MHFEELNLIFEYFIFQKTSGLGKLGTSTSGDPHLTVGFVVPKSYFLERNYMKAIKNAVFAINKKTRPKYKFLEKYKFDCGDMGRGSDCADVEMKMMDANPSPKGKFVSGLFLIILVI